MRCHIGTRCRPRQRGETAGDRQSSAIARRREPLGRARCPREDDAASRTVTSSPSASSTPLPRAAHTATHPPSASDAVTAGPAAKARGLRPELPLVRGPIVCAWLAGRGTRRRDSKDNWRRLHGRSLSTTVSVTPLNTSAQGRRGPGCCATPAATYSSARPATRVQQGRDRRARGGEDRRVPPWLRLHPRPP
jgi:hypothetical protein